MYTAMLFLTYIITFSISFERISLKIVFIWAMLPKQIFLFPNIKKRWIISGVIFIFMYQNNQQATYFQKLIPMKVDY